MLEKVIDITNVSDRKESINVTGAAGQKVKLATKLFSHTISSAISWCDKMGHLDDENLLECATLFKQINDWFDIMNSSVPKVDSRERMKAYGCARDIQNRTLEKMNETVSNKSRAENTTVSKRNNCLIMPYNCFSKI